MAMGEKKFRGGSIKIIMVEGGKDFESTAGDVLRVDGGGSSMIFIIWVPIDTWMHA